MLQLNCLVSRTAYEIYWHRISILTSTLLSSKLTSHNMEVSENNPESPLKGKIKCMHKQCVPGAFPFFPMARVRLSTAQTLVLCPDPTLLQRKGSGEY